MTSLVNFNSFTSFLKGSDPLLDFYWDTLYIPRGLDPKYLENASIPFYSLMKKEGLFGSGTFTYYPGFREIDDFQITFYEDHNLTVTKWINAWKEDIRNPIDGSYNYPVNYKDAFKFQLYNTKGEVKATADLLGVWPTQQSEWSLTYESTGDRIKVEHSFSIDNIRIKFQ